MSMHSEPIKIPDSGRLVCTVKLKPFDSPILSVFEYKIDTGADFTTISKETLHRLNYTNKWIDENKKLSKGSTTVATGEEIESYYVEIPMISIYGVRGRNYQ